MITESQIQKLRLFKWDKIFSLIHSLKDNLNDHQWRFLKAIVIEKAIEKYSNSNFKYVGEIHKDYDWKKEKISVELKSNVTASMYKKNGSLRSIPSIKLTNSLGTNRQTINKDDVCDIILIVKKDGAFVIDKKTALRNTVRYGDGFNLELDKKDIVEITGKVDCISPKRCFDTKQKVLDLIERTI